MFCTTYPSIYGYNLANHRYTDFSTHAFQKKKFIEHNNGGQVGGQVTGVNKSESPCPHRLTPKCTLGCSMHSTNHMC